jgi:hypothetical protein
MYGVGGTAGLVDSVNQATASLSPHSATLAGPNYTVNTYNMYSNGVFGRAGDLANFYDSPGNDTFSASQGLAWMWDSGSTYLNEAAGFSYNYAYSTHGGQDQALFYASAGNNIFEAGMLHGSSDAAMTNPGGTCVNAAMGFSADHAYASAGSGGTAYLFDDPNVGGTLLGNGSDATMIDPNAYITASGFQNVYAYSTSPYLDGDTATLGQTTYDLHLYGLWDVNDGGPSYYP